MHHDLSKYSFQITTFSTLITGDNFSTSVAVDSASMGVVLSLPTLAGATSVAFKGQGSLDGTTNWTDLATSGATSVVVANLDVDTTKRVFSISSTGLYKFFRVKATIVGSPTGAITGITYQIPQNGVNINANKR